MFICMFVDICMFVYLDVSLDSISYLVFKYNKIDNKNRTVIYKLCIKS